MLNPMWWGKALNTCSSVGNVLLSGPSSVREGLLGPQHVPRVGGGVSSELGWGLPSVSRAEGEVSEEESMGPHPSYFRCF